MDYEEVTVQARLDVLKVPFRPSSEIRNGEHIKYPSEM